MFVLSMSGDMGTVMSSTGKHDQETARFFDKNIKLSASAVMCTAEIFTYF